MELPLERRGSARSLAGQDDHFEDALMRKVGPRTGTRVIRYSPRIGAGERFGEVTSRRGPPRHEPPDNSRPDHALVTSPRLARPDNPPVRRRAGLDEREIQMRERHRLVSTEAATVLTFEPGTVWARSVRSMMRTTNVDSGSPAASGPG